MTLDGFLTFLTLVIAGIALMSPADRLRLNLRSGWPIICGILAFGFVTYLQLFTLLQMPCPIVLGSSCKYISFGQNPPITPQQISFFVAIGWFGFSAFWVRRRAVGTRALPVLARLIERLELEQRHADIIELVEPNLPLLTRAIKHELWGAATHHRLQDKLRINQQEIVTELLVGKPKASRLRQAFRCMHRGTLLLCTRFVPRRSAAEEAAEKILRLLLLSPGLLNHLIRYRIDFAVKLLRCASSSYDVHAFFERYLEGLLNDTSSRLYEEVRNNQNVSYAGRYFIRDDNVFLNYLFSDPSAAEALSAWQPAGEAFISRFNAHSSPEYVLFINGPGRGFDKDRWRDPSYVTIRFFDIMVSAAAFAGVPWHMWLYYFPHFVDVVLKVHDETGSEIDRAAEWPTRGSYLIYEMFDAIGSWIRCYKHLDRSSPHRVIKSIDAQTQNDNIPKSAAIALGMCLEKVIASEKVSQSYKNYLTEISLRIVSDLGTSGDEADLRRVLILSLLREGRSPPLGQALRVAYEEIDWVLKAKVDDFGLELTRLYGL